MAKIIYTVLSSIDGYIADVHGNFDWAEPREDVHKYINVLESRNSLGLYGRKTFEIMRVWEHMPSTEKYPEYIREYEQIWKSAKKVVYSSTIRTTETENTSIKTKLDKIDIEKMKAVENGDISVSGSGLASQIIDMGLIDEIFLFEFPVCIGNGRKWIYNIKPVNLDRIEVREFLNGVIMIHYQCK